jgi:hypothetical protein
MSSPVAVAEIGRVAWRAAVPAAGWVGVGSVLCALDVVFSSATMTTAAAARSTRRDVRIVERGISMVGLGSVVSGVVDARPPRHRESLRGDRRSRR